MTEEREAKPQRRGKTLRGMGSVYQRGEVWWVCYYYRGKQFRESAHASGKRGESVARELLKKRLGEIHSGGFIGPREDRVTFEDMVADLENDYAINGRRSLHTAKYHIAHLREVFGFSRAVDITLDRVRAYQSQRIKEGAAPATVNREVSYLGKMLTLAVGAGKLSRRPRFTMLQENNVREGFLEHGEFLSLLSHLPPHLKGVVEFLYLSGWRKSEALKLEWRDVSLPSRVVRLRVENSKNKEARTLPLTGRLWEVIQERARERRLDTPQVFHHGGRRIQSFRKAWRSACDAAELGGVIPHDLRRCAARNLSRAGVPEVVAMSITGHKTNSMYRRYRIVDERDLREATEKMQLHLAAQLPKVS
jgi:integrase